MIPAIAAGCRVVVTKGIRATFFFQARHMQEIHLRIYSSLDALPEHEVQRNLWDKIIVIHLHPVARKDVPPVQTNKCVVKHHDYSIGSMYPRSQKRRL